MLKNIILWSNKNSKLSRCFGFKKNSDFCFCFIILITILTIVFDFGSFFILGYIPNFILETYYPKSFTFIILLIFFSYTDR